MKPLNHITCLRLIFSGLLLFLFIHYWDSAVKLVTMILNAAMPLLIGFATAYVLNILMSFYEKHYFPKYSRKKAVIKSRRAVCLAGALLTLAAAITAIIRLVIPELVSCLRFIASELPELSKKLFSSKLMTQLLPEDVLKTLSDIDLSEYLSMAVDYLVNGFSNMAGTVFSAVASVFSGILNTLISFIFAVYILVAKDTLCNQFRRLANCFIPQKYRSYALHVLSVFNRSFHSFIVGQCLEAAILGILCTIGMLIFQFPYATMIGALIGFTALVPIAGALIGAGIGTVMIFTISPVKAVLFVIFIVVLQQLEENLIYPKVVGKSVGLPSLWVLAAVTVGGGLMGIAGMLIGVPVAAGLYQLIRESLNKREKLSCNAHKDSSA